MSNQPTAIAALHATDLTDRLFGLVDASLFDLPKAISTFHSLDEEHTKYARPWPLGTKRKITVAAQLVNQAGVYSIDIEQECEQNAILVLADELKKLHEERNIVAFLGPVLFRLELAGGPGREFMVASYPLVEKFTEEELPREF